MVLIKFAKALDYTYYISVENKYMGSSSLIVLTIAAIAFSAGAIIVSRLFVKGSKNSQKGQAYECGIPSKESPWKQFNVGYYLFALMFLIFDVELIFLYPWAVVVKQTGWLALVEILIFFFILFMGFLYAHKKGALKWM
ncbi:MAG TPA: NADH-quinone oxidoreductase subunit A [Puia sp.]|nr:NADH-quinone oxidoreductase subunit A [Puia sp.]